MIKCLAVVGMALFAQNALAGGNVALYIAVGKITVSNKASNHPGYMALELSGKVSRPDAAVEGLPKVIPENLKILLKPGNEADKFLASFCEKYASQAKATNQSLRVDVFLDQPNDLVRLIEGGMSDNRFNAFTIGGDTRASSISCSLEG